METLLAFQHWLYTGVGQGLTDVAQGNVRAVFVAMAAAVLFGAVHALMPGHGKTVLISYHLGQPTGIKESMLNGAILALTHVGLAIILVLAGFTVISRAFAYGGRAPHFETASGVLIALIGAFLLWRSIRHDHTLQAKPNGKGLAMVTGMVPCPLTTFILSYALARDVLAAALVVTTAMLVGMILTIGGVAAAAALARKRVLGFLDRTVHLRWIIGRGLEIGGAVAVTGLGLLTIVAAAA